MAVSPTQHIAGFVLQPGAPTAAVERELLSAGIVLPAGYWSLMQFANGSEGFLGTEYLRFYPAEQLIPLNSAFCTEEFIPGRLIFGSNGGGEAWVFDVRLRPALVIKLPFIPMNDQYGESFGSFEQFLRLLAGTNEPRAQRSVNPDLIGKEIHEIHPVVFGGDPASEDNKAYLTPPEYAPYVVWWNRQYRRITKP
jgi:hypothetical protein